MLRVLQFYGKINKQNARPGGDTEDKTFGKPFPNGRFYGLKYVLFHIRCDIASDTDASVKFIYQYKRCLLKNRV